MSQLKKKAVKVTEFAFSLPSYRLTIVYLLAYSFLAGVIGFVCSNGWDKPADAFFLGGAEGIILVALPAVASAALAASIVSRQNFRLGFKRFVFVGFLASLIYGLTVFAGFIVSWTGIAPSFFAVQSFVLVANALVLATWFVAAFLALNYGVKAFLVSAFHPLFNLSFLVIWSGYGRIAPAIEFGSPWLVFVRMALAAAVILLALWSIFFLINAPAKRNFGISAVQSTALFFAQLHSGTKGLEEVMAEMSERVRTQVSVVAFRTRKGRLKASFVIPMIHFGPFGNLGGSEFPALLGSEIEERTGAPSLVFHGTAYHDFNPVYSSSASRLSREVASMVSSAKQGASSAVILRASKDSCGVAGLAFGSNAFLTLSRAPKGTEDIDVSVGLALANRVLARGFSEAVLVDRHNSKTQIGVLDAGSRLFYDYEDVIDLLKPVPVQRQQAFKLGVACDSLSDFKPEQGIGRAGLKVAVFEVGGKRFCILLFDANNCLPSFREEILSSLSRFGFDFVDVMTTDTHAVNNLYSVHNPLGLRANRFELVERTVKAV
ncbi:MAG: DUF2070 family protein, partial [Candidatus Norongarragalinales archaeon]